MAISIVRDLAAALAPARCVGCGARAEPVCDDCARTLRGAVAAPPPPGVDWWVAPLAYEGLARELVARVKYRNHRFSISWLGAMISGAIATRTAIEVQAVTFPPTTRTRAGERGFDHAQLLAREVARQLQLPLVTALRRVDEQAQTGRSRPERRQGPQYRARPGSYVGYLLVDDIATTGGTLASAARALRAAGATTVAAATAARTPPPGAPRV